MPIRVTFRRRSRRGLSRIEAVVLSIIVLFATVGGTAWTIQSREKAHVDACLNRMRHIGTALYLFSDRTGAYPGYMNALESKSGKLYVDPASGEVAPVSWAVMILHELDQEKLYDRLIYDSSPSTASNYVDDFHCPSDPRLSTTRPILSYVVNTGMPDAPQAQVLEDKGMKVSIPRDWAANGIFFDNFTDHKLIKPSLAGRGMQVVMRDEMIRDRKDYTILLTENIDAGEYLLSTAKHSADHWKAAEVQLGCTWQYSLPKPDYNPPVMTPPVNTLRINVGKGRGNGLSHDYCRPSSNHPGGVNVVYAGQNAIFLNEKISYFIFAKLMASDDEDVRLAGQKKHVDINFRMYQLYYE